MLEDLFEEAAAWAKLKPLADLPCACFPAVTAVLTPDLIHSMLAIAALWWTWGALEACLRSHF